MHFQSTAAATLLASATAVSASSFVKRDSWGAAFSLGPAKQDIITTSVTIYPGTPIPDQGGYLFAWLGISNGTGELIQSIIGSYPEGGSECSGDPSTSWCISSEVYGSGYQYVGELTTADYNYTNGIVVNYTLTDAAAYTWKQTMTDAVTGTLLSTFTRNSGPMLGWGTALECDDKDGVTCAGTIDEQIYENAVIVLESADSTFSDTMGVGTGVTHTDMETTDGGKTWTISKIVLPAMRSLSSTTAAATSTAVSSVTSVAHAAVTASVETASSFVTSVKSATSATSAATTTSTKSKHHGHQGTHVPSA